jgi:hypothetical protein
MIDTCTACENPQNALNRMLRITNIVLARYYLVFAVMDFIIGVRRSILPTL